MRVRLVPFPSNDGAKSLCEETSTTKAKKTKKKVELRCLTSKVE